MSKRETHERRRMAAIAANQQQLDEFFPPNGECAFCEDVLGARHRVIDAIAELIRAGDPPWKVASEYGVPVEAVAIALAVQ